MFPSIQWHSESIKHEFMKVYKELIKADADSWNRVQARHNNYLRCIDKLKQLEEDYTNGKYDFETYKYFKKEFRRGLFRH